MRRMLTDHYHEFSPIGPFNNSVFCNLCFCQAAAWCPAVVEGVARDAAQAMRAAFLGAGWVLGEWYLEAALSWVDF